MTTYKNYALIKDLIHSVNNFKIEDISSYNLNESLILSLIIKDPSLFPALEKYMSDDMLYVIFSFSQINDDINIADYELSDRVVKIIKNMINTYERCGDRIFYPKDQSNLFHRTLTYVERDKNDMDKYNVRGLNSHLSLELDCLIEDIVYSLHTDYKLLHFVHKILKKNSDNVVRFHRYIYLVEKHPNFSTARAILREINCD